MPVSQSSALKTAADPHLHVPGQNCPYCDRPIPDDKLEEISGRIEARARARLAEATGRLREQYVRERSQNEAKAKAELDQAKKEAAALAHRLKAEAAAREAKIREEAKLQAAAETRAQLETARRERQESEGALRTQVAKADGARAAAEQARVELDGQLQTIRAAKAAEIETLRREAAAREKTIRDEAAKAAEDAVREKLAAAEGAKTDAERRRAAAETALQGKLAEAGQQIQTLKEEHANEINTQREVLEKDKADSVNTERAAALAVRMKLEGELADMQRRLQQKTAHEHGEGDELDLFEVLKAAFEGDRIRRVDKGERGADVIHEVVENGKVVGKIVYDRKNRGNWLNEYATKLREDQVAEKADHAILSTNKFPKGKRELCVHERVVLACPARVLALAEILRIEIIHNHELRVSNDERDAKTEALYVFITSTQCRQLLESVEALIGKLEQIDADEQKAHTAVWQKRFKLLRAVLKSNGDLRFALGRIVGTAEAAE